MKPFLLCLTLVGLFSGFSMPPVLAQEDAAAKVEAAGRSIMSDPRLRNVLRNVKQDPGAALEEMKQDPEEAVREATRVFQANTNGIDAETLKAAATQAKTDGTLDKAVAKVQNEGTLDTAMAKASELAAKELPATNAAASSPLTASPAAPAVPAAEVPATRPAPGISGGVPTPVAMPVEGITPVAVPVEPSAVARPSTDALPSAVAAAKGTVVQQSKVEPLVGSSPTIPELPVLGANEVPAPVPLSKKYEQGPNGGYPTADKKHMEILSKESIMDNTKGVLLFTGNVFIDHPEFEIKCDKLEIQLAEGVGMEGSEGGAEAGGNFKRAIASGGMVEITRVALDEKGRKKTQIAIARSADYNAITKDIVLSGGPPYIQDGDRFVKTSSEDAKIIMRGNGLYEITGSTNRATIVIPIENKPGAPAKKKGAPGASGFENPLEGFIR